VSHPSPAAVDVPSGDLAGVEPDAGAAAGAVVLRLGASRYAVDMADVAEVAQLPRVTRVPRSQAWLLGVANWRGRVLPVLDLRPLLATDTIPLASSARVVVLARDDVVVGVVAESVPGVYSGALTDPVPAPPTLTGEAAALVAGQVSDRAGPLAVLDAVAVLALRERVDRRRGGSSPA
jgi:chemotaxis signal transduction protein